MEKKNKEKLVDLDPFFEKRNTNDLLELTFSSTIVKSAILFHLVGGQKNGQKESKKWKASNDLVF